MKTPQYADFPGEEFERRYARARDLMQKRGLGALLITERSNYIYFSGHRSVQNPIDKIRPFIVILPVDRPPVQIFPAFEAAQVAHTCHIVDARPISSLHGVSSEIASILAELNLGSAQIGCEFGHGQYLGISYSDVNSLVRLCPRAKFVDASDIFVWLRAVKSSLELTYLRRSCEINASAQESAARDVRAGMSEIDVARILRGHLVRLGAEEITFLSVISPENGQRGICAIPTERKIERGQMLGFDVGVSINGYCSDVARTLHVGRPSQQFLDFYAWMMDLQYACVDQLRSGNRPCDVLAVCNKMLAEAGQSTMGAGRIGHGVGVETTEYPSLAASENIVFEPGFVLACNPNFVNDFGFMNAEDNWLVTTSAPEVLSTPRAGAGPIIV